VPVLREQKPPLVMGGRHDLVIQEQSGGLFLKRPCMSLYKCGIVMMSKKTTKELEHFDRAGRSPDRKDGMNTVFFCCAKIRPNSNTVNTPFRQTNLKETVPSVPVFCFSSTILSGKELSHD